MKVVVHAHMHYADLMPQVSEYLAQIPFPYDLIVTLTDASAKAFVLATIAQKVPHARPGVVVVNNKGRDVKPFYTDVASLLEGYDIIGHIHGKKSIFNNGATRGWLDHLLQGLMGSEEIVGKIFDRFRLDPRAGVIYPHRFYQIPYWANTWLSNRGWAARLQDRLGLPTLPESYFPYPIGNMFWARKEAIRPLLELGLRDEDYPDEKGQNDGEIMHALERMTTVVARHMGYTNYVIRQEAGSVGIRDDREGVDLSAYHGSSLDYLREGIRKPHIKVVSFDIFDTLVVRPLNDPADLFELMQNEVEQIKDKPVDFRQVRREADRWQRERLAADKDVTLEDIYERVAAMLELSDLERETLMALELRLESKYMRPRTSVVEVMNYAFILGKRVILTSDMYLDKVTLTGLLNGLGIVDYHALYLSADIGKRKDARTLFPHILAAEGVRGEEMIHIGDNEHSDLQIAGDAGITTFHVLRSMELFRQTPLGKTGFPGNENSLFARVSMGLMLTRLFDDPFPRHPGSVNGDLHNFGYWYFGPILLAFVKWVAGKSIEERIDTLYFLARDGDVLVRIYALLQNYLKKPSPRGVYLEVSRRSISVPFIQRREQLDKLLHAEYPGGPLSELLRVRLGFDLAIHPEINVRDFGFAGIHSAVFIPADMTKIKRLAYYIFERYSEHFLEEKEQALGYLRQMGLFDAGSKAVVDIGYSGTLQRILNEIGPGEPIHGYYMVLYKTFDTLIRNPNVRACGLFGDRIDPYLKTLSVDKYSLFYEMILSSTRGPVVRYEQDGEGYKPVYAPVSTDERYKLLKLPQIHEGILHYCRDVLELLDNAELIRCDEPAFLLRPFQWFLEHPAATDLEMLAGYSLDDEYCGQGVLYWAPPPLTSKTQEEGADQTAPDNLPTDDFLWKKYVPQASLWGGGKETEVWEDYGGFANRREYEVFHWYREQYEELPVWYKKIGQFFKILKGTKRIRIILEDVGYVRNHATKADEIQAWYNKEYEVLPKWYKRFGQFIRALLGRRSWSRKAPTQPPHNGQLPNGHIIS